jgi:cyclopropane fatty-acyl-phospholipid synthase-like methyltransferase
VGYYDTEENAREYMHIAEGFDGRELIERLRELLDPGSTVLELGMGPGKDLRMLAETYKVTGSDLSDAFLSLFRQENPEADLLKLDAVAINTDRRFDCIYSNKVLHHLTRAELQSSMARQAEILAPGGLILHTFWKGNGVEEMGGLRFVYYTEDDIRSLVERNYQVVILESYTEMEHDDSILLIGRRT